MLSGLIIALAGCVTAILSVYPNFQVSPKGRKIVFACAVVTLCSAFWTLYENDQQTKEFSAKITAAQKEVSDLQRQLTDAQQEIISAQTGKGSTVYLEPSIRTLGDRTALEFDIAKRGKWAVYDVSFEVTDLVFNSKMQETPIAERQHLIDGYTKTFQIPTVSLPYYKLKGFRTELTGREEYRARIEILARNGCWVEMLTLRQVNGAWLSAMNLSWYGIAEITTKAATDLTPKGTVIELVHPSFPRKTDGTVEW